MTSWKPTATLKTLRARAALISSIRSFFNKRQVLEVETPLLGQFGVTDVYLENIKASSRFANQKEYFLQTSPEYFMKRLLAFGCDSIFQISKAFRDEEKSPLHLQEFSMLEWYRLGFSHHELMDEVDDLMQLIIEVPSAERISYQKLFLRHLNLCPLSASINDLKKVASENGVSLGSSLNSKDEWLFLLLSHLIEPNLGFERPLFVYDYPASQASLAKLNKEKTCGHRFELYFKGVELANGFWELSNPKEQRERFNQDNLLRKQYGLDERLIDENFLSALEQGLPECSGVALGLDRLIMLALEKESIDEVVSFA